MKVSGTSTLTAARPEVFRALNDPAVLVASIPGCRRLEMLGVDAYAMTVAAGVGSIKGVYDGQVRLSDHEEPSSFRMHAQGAGAPGTIGAEVLVRLADVDGGGTALTYEAEATVGGMIGGVGQRMLAGVIQEDGGRVLQERRPGPGRRGHWGPGLPAEAAPPPPSGGPARPRPPRPRRSSRRGPQRPGPCSPRPAPPRRAGRASAGPVPHRRRGRGGGGAGRRDRRRLDRRAQRLPGLTRARHRRLQHGPRDGGAVAGREISARELLELHLSRLASRSTPRQRRGEPRRRTGPARAPRPPTRPPPGAACSGPLHGLPHALQGHPRGGGLADDVRLAAAREPTCRAATS